MDEKQKIEHQVELAKRTAAYVSDPTVAQRLKNLADALTQRLFDLMHRSKVRARAHELWEQAGRPPDRDLEFWLEAERQVKEEREREGS